jgi:Tol biopolymer transport system component
MATGRRLTSGERPQTDALPEKLGHIIHRCLEQDPHDRWQTARDVKAELEWAARPTPTVTSAAVAVPPERHRVRWMLPSIAAVSMTVTAVLSIMWLRKPAPLDLSAYRYRPFAFSKEPEVGGAWSPDGKNIAFVRSDALMVQAVDGGGATQLAERADDTSIAWSPDGSRVYFIKKTPADGIYAVNRAGGEPELVLASDRIRAFDLSRDGKVLAVWRAAVSPDGIIHSSIWISSPPGAEAHEYAPAPFALKHSSFGVLRFSPDGKMLFLSMNSTTPETWLLPFPPGAGAPRRIFRNVKWKSPPRASWMPDSRRLVLANNFAPLYFSALWLADTRDESLIQIDDGSSHQSYPAVSPDGRQLLVTRSEEDADLVELPLDGSAPRELLATSLAEYGPAWSPKGGQYGYVTNRNGTTEIWLRSSQGDWERPILTTKEFPHLVVRALAISPDGSRIVYAAALADELPSVYISPVAGGTPTWVAPGGAPSWSPDGKSIVFIFRKPGGLYVLATLRLGANQQPVEVRNAHCANTLSAPRWSPSGEWIACVGRDGPVLISPDGKATHALTGWTHMVAWSKDGNTLYGLPTVNGRSSLVAWDVRTSVQRKVADYGSAITPYDGAGLNLSLSADGKSLATDTFKERTDLWILEGFAK